jgi:hypothetical protein
MNAEEMRVLTYHYIDRNKEQVYTDVFVIITEMAKCGHFQATIGMPKNHDLFTRLTEEHYEKLQRLGYRLFRPKLDNYVTIYWD